MALIRLRATSTIMVVDRTGTLTTYHKGDWFECGKQQAIELIETHQAEIPEEADQQRALMEDLSDCGILVVNGSLKAARAIMGQRLDYAESKEPLSLPWPRTLIWNPRHPLEPKQITLGFVRVEDTGRYASWEVAAMLRANEMLALEIGNGEEQRRTREAVGDLRLPVYDVGAVWVRKTVATEQLVKAWSRERADSDCEEHAFLRALYANRVLLCSLPAGWLSRWRR